MTATGHDFGWALEQLKAGKKVTRESYHEKHYLVLDHMFRHILFQHFNERYQTDIGYEDIIATDWELYEEKE